MDSNYFSKAYFEFQNFLNEDDQKKLLELTSLKKYPADTVLLKSGEFTNQVGIVLEGLIRVYDAEDKSVLFVSEGQVFGSMDTLALKKPSKYTYETIEDTKLFILNNDELEASVQTHPNIGILLLNYWKQTAIDIFINFNSFIKYSPEERYEQLIKKHSHLILRVKSKYLASYLGLHPASLSRLKSRYLKNLNENHISE